MQKKNSTKNNNQQKFDVVVIGGGPAGMMAAGRAGEGGARVLLLEKNDSLGKKLLLTGNGRCNLTQAEFDDKKFVESLGKKGKFLYSALSVFGPEETVEFFARFGVPTKIEKGEKVFPVSDKAQDVLGALKKYLQKNKVSVMTQADVVGFAMNEDRKKITGVRLKNKIIQADKFILATGGKSYQMTGSMGDGYVFARECGHKIITPIPVLVPLKTEEKWVKETQGVSLKNIEIGLVRGGDAVTQGRDAVTQGGDAKFCVSTTGDIIFTHFGLSGPAILNLSRTLADLKNDPDKIIISLDLKPELDKEELDVQIQKDFAKHINKNIVNYLPELVPQKLAEIFLRLVDIPKEKKINILTKEDRLRIINLLKDLRLTVADNAGFAQAMVTRGGVDLKEVDPKIMQSKVVKNLYLAGEVLDLDGPTGGYNLQIAWSTGYAAGMATGKKAPKI